MIPYKIKIDIDGQRDITSNVTLSVGDVNGYGLVLEFCREGKPYDITGYNLSVHAMPSGATLPIPDIGTVEGGKGYYIIKPSMYAYAGETKLEVILSDGNGSTVTKVLHFPVRSGFSSFGGSVADEKDYTVLQTLIQQAQSAISQAEAALAVAEAGNVLARRLTGGEGEHSLVTAEVAKALGDYAVSLGSGSVSGSKAYYIQSIDFDNQEIYLTTEEAIPVGGKGTVDTSFETPAYEAGDVFSVVSSGMFPFCGVIESVTNNVVTWSSIDPYFERRGLGEIASLFSVPTKPTIGAVVIGDNSFSFGKDLVSAGEGTFSGGEGNIAGGDYSAGFGKDNKAGFGTLVGGVYNTFPGSWNIGGGSSNTADLTTRGSIIGGYGNTFKGSAYGLYSGYQNITDAAVYALLSGNSNKLTGNYDILNGENNDILASFILSLGKGLKTETDNQVLLGKWNALNPNAAILYGNGTSNTNRKNTFEIYKDGAAKFTNIIDHDGNKYLRENEGYLSEDKQYNLKRGINITITGNHNEGVGRTININGDYNTLKGQFLSCIGNFNYIEGKSCHTTGDFNFIRGDFLNASGNQIVLGKHNVEDPDKIFIIGGGTSSQKKNIFTIDREGHIAYAAKEAI